MNIKKNKSPVSHMKICTSKLKIGNFLLTCQIKMTNVSGDHKDAQ